MTARSKRVRCWLIGLLTTGLILLAASAPAAVTQLALELDSEFGANGFASLPDITIVDFAYGSGGETAVVGLTVRQLSSSAQRPRFKTRAVIVMLDRSGRRVKRFAADGVLRIDLGRGSVPGPRTATFDGSGRLLLLSVKRLSDSTMRLDLTRIAPNGRPDHRFGRNGTVTLRRYRANASLSGDGDDLFVMGDGAIRVFETDDGGNRIWALKANGRIDRRYGSGGKSQRDPCGWAGQGLAYWSADGGAIFARYCQNLRLDQYTKDGSLRRRWSSGWMNPSFSTEDSRQRVVVQDVDQNSVPFLQRLLADGSRDQSFAGDGTLTFTETGLPAFTQPEVGSFYLLPAANDGTHVVADESVQNTEVLTAAELDGDGNVVGLTPKYVFDPPGRLFSDTVSPGPGGSMTLISYVRGRPVLSRLLIGTDPPLPRTR